MIAKEEFQWHTEVTAAYKYKWVYSGAAVALIKQLFQPIKLIASIPKHQPFISEMTQTSAATRI
jgi:hypothetical protein